MQMSCDLIDYTPFVDEMVIGELDLSTVTMATVVTMEPLVTDAQSLVSVFYDVHEITWSIRKMNYGCYKIMWAV